MKIFKCYDKDILYALEAIHVIKQGEECNAMEPVTEESMSKFLSDPNNYLIVAVINNIVVGYVVAYEFQRVDRNARIMYLYEIDVLQKYRNKGIGSSLIQHLKEICREKNIMKMWLETNRSNSPAMRLYTKTGGKQVAGDDEVSFTYYPPFE